MKSKFNKVVFIFILASLTSSYFFLINSYESDPNLNINENLPLVSQESITVDSPTSFSNWKTGESYNIEWNSTGTISYIEIELYQSSNFIETIASSTYDDGSYTWTLGHDLEESDNYRIKITDTSNSTVYDYSSYFTIEKGRNIEITTPSSLTTWEAGTSHTIYWNSQGDVSYVNIELYEDNNYEGEISTNEYNDGSYSWNIPKLTTESTNYQIKIIDSSYDDIFDFSSKFTILEYRSITISSPSSSSSLTTGSSIHIRWSSTGAISNVKISLYHRNGRYQKTITSRTSDDGSYRWNIPHSLVSGQYYIMVEDSNDSSVSDRSSYFQITNVVHVTLIIIGVIGAIGIGTYFLFYITKKEKGRGIKEAIKTVQESSVAQRKNLALRESKIERAANMIWAQKNKRKKIEYIAQRFAKKS
jgi:hypothetical protein